MAVELVIAAPVLVALVLMVAGAARMGEARQEVTSAAADAARAASLTRTPTEAATAGERAAT
ncbi:MAG: hypothetical protein GEV09_27075, partial [Pseudonocardiaceae bacterium]|nr:hypothetical protein [Pseudonocardiaceae bacterium]